MINFKFVSLASSNEFSEYAPKVLLFLLNLDFWDMVRLEFLDLAMLVADLDFDLFLFFDVDFFLSFLLLLSLVDFLLFMLLTDFDRMARFDFPWLLRSEVSLRKSLNLFWGSSFSRFVIYPCSVDSWLWCRLAALGIRMLGMLPLPSFSCSIVVAMLIGPTFAGGCIYWLSAGTSWTTVG